MALREALENPAWAARTEYDGVMGRRQAQREIGQEQAGGVEAVASVLTIRDSILPPTINYEFPDPECDLDYVPNEARPHQADVVLSNSFGLGGQNASIVLRRYRP